MHQLKLLHLEKPLILQTAALMTMRPTRTTTCSAQLTLEMLTQTLKLMLKLMLTQTLKLMLKLMLMLMLTLMLTLRALLKSFQSTRLKTSLMLLLKRGWNCPVGWNLQEKSLLELASRKVSEKNWCGVVYRDAVDRGEVLESMAHGILDRDSLVDARPATIDVPANHVLIQDDSFRPCGDLHTHGFPIYRGCGYHSLHQRRTGPVRLV